MARAARIEPTDGAAIAGRRSPTHQTHRNPSPLQTDPTDTMRVLAEKILHRIFNNRCSERCGSLVFVCQDRRVYVVRESSAGIAVMLERHAGDFVGLYGGNPRVDRLTLNQLGILAPVMPKVDQLIADLLEHFRLNGIEVPANG